MDKLDMYTVVGITVEDTRKIILDFLNDLELTIDDDGRVWYEYGEHIANAVRVERGRGIAVVVD